MARQPGLETEVWAAIEAMRTRMTFDNDIAAVQQLFTEYNQALAVLARVEQMCTVALPQFNWGASALSAEAIQLLNQVPGEVREALAEEQP